MDRLPIRVCFVCLGNICRSPTAEGVFNHLLRSQGLEELFLVDSAGTGAYHEGERADKRARQTAKSRGLELTSIARQFLAADFENFDYIVAMDHSNVGNLVAISPDRHSTSKVSLLRDFDAECPEGSEVPDPYYGGDNGFEEVFDICKRSCQGLIDFIKKEHGL